MTFVQERGDWSVVKVISCPASSTQKKTETYYVTLRNK